MATERRKGARPVEVAADYNLPPRLKQTISMIGYEVDSISQMLMALANGTSEWTAVHALTSRLSVLANAAMDIAGDHEEVRDIEQAVFPMGDPRKLSLNGLLGTIGLSEEADYT